MILDHPAQIMAMIRSGKMVHIGGRPIIVPEPGKPARAHGRSHAIKLALAFVAIYVIWGSTYLAIRYAVETIPPLVTAGIRHSIAGGIMLAWAWWRGFRPTRQQWVAGFALGALFFLVGHGTLHWAEQHVGSGLAALLMATEPMFILALGWIMGQQKISGASALGLGLGVVGVALLTGAELTVKGSSLLGLLAVLLGSLSWSLGVVISPRLKLPSDALGRTALPTICGAAMLLIAAGVTGEFQHTHWASISLRSVFGLGYLITFGSVVAFTSYTWLLQRVPPALVATHTYANPVVAVLLGWFLAHEPLSMRVVMASLAILAAIVLIRRGERTAVIMPPRAVPPVAEVQTSEECA
ncbi:MAG TPA: EamA family transporter [Candidatus Acidoferrum sp.]|jgi:drug/metabolite transporter (DMT)-like permease|nr:EamA family transporter [Candidatus Acidoferrum sp.]